ncbi:MAG: ABC transporter ATP-binding protein [Nitrospiraceae bacterium]|nr:ABC transporter ATP-binding protein [Nitrospiraceae bacterium]
MSETLLEIKDLSVYLDDGTHRAKKEVAAVSGLSFDVRRSEVFGLVGESGCGKSLTALSILRILPSNISASGRVLFNDKDLLSLDEDRMRSIRGRDISMIFQEPMTSLNPVLTIGRQIEEALIAHTGSSKSEAREKAESLLASVLMPQPGQRLREYPHQLSGGMRQRVMIAMAIACSPSLLIADEPTTALDVTIQAQILRLLQDLRKRMNMAVLLITHDLGIIAENADRVAIMYAGRIMELADAKTIFDRPLNPYTIGLLESLPASRGSELKPIPGFVPAPDRLPSGCKFSDRCFAAKDECRLHEPLLEEAEQNHMVRCIRWKEITRPAC